MVMEEGTTPKSKGVIAGIGAAIAAGFVWLFAHALPEEIGKIFGHIVGPHLILPGLLIAASWWIASKTLKPELKPVVPVVGVIGGQLLMFLLGAFLGGMDALIAASLDIVVTAAGLIWLFKRPGTAPLIVLMAYEILVLLINFQVLLSSGLSERLVESLLYPSYATTRNLSR
jgi:hypothetical protein